jgi:hypothetical protein
MIRAVLLMAAIACAGCARGTPPPAAPPAPVPQPPALRMSPRDILLCVVRRGELELVHLEYDTRSGDSTCQGVPIARVFPLDSTYAGAAEWFALNEPIRMDGRVFVRSGDPRVLGIQELTPVGEYRGVRVFAAAGGHLPPSVVYLPVRPGCEFQPDQINTR